MIAVGCAGYLFRGLDWGKRAGFCFAGLLLMLPTWQGLWLLADVAGLAFGTALICWEWSRRSTRKAILSPLDTSQG